MHILAGVIIGVLLRMMGVDLKWAIGVAVFLIVGWEVYETLSGVREFWMNIFLDIIVGLVSFWFSYSEPILQNKRNEAILLAGLFVIWIALSVSGWLAYKNRVAKESNKVASSQQTQDISRR